MATITLTTTVNATNNAALSLNNTVHGSATRRQRASNEMTQTASHSSRQLHSRPNQQIHSVSPEDSEAFPTQDGHVRYAEQPSHWASHLRGMPRYRPLNTELDRSLRPLGADGGARFFLTFMLTGVFVQEMANRSWRATLGKLTTNLFRFKIGGRW